MSEPDAIATGLAERLATIPDFEHRAYDVWPDALNVPCAIVDGPTDESAVTLGDRGTYDYDIVVLVPMKGGLAAAQREARKYMARIGESSIRQALQVDLTLGGRAETLIVQDGIRTMADGTVNGVDVFGIVRSVKVYTGC